MSAARRYFAAVVQAPVTAVTEAISSSALMANNAALVVRQVDAICAMTPTPPRLFVFPALFLTSGRRKDSSLPAHAVAMELPDARLDLIIDACRRHECWIASTIQETLPAFPGQFFHTTIVLGPSGVVLRSPKAQAHSAPGVTVLKDILSAYRDAYGADSVMPVVETPIGRLGSLSLKETRVPEVGRYLERHGAEIIVHPSGERQGDPPMHAFRQGLAYSLGVWWLTASRSRDLLDDGAEDWFGGRSAIYAPDGSVRAEVSGVCEGFALAAIDLDELAEIRARQFVDTEPAAALYRDIYV